MLALTFIMLFPSISDFRPTDSQRFIKRSSTDSESRCLSLPDAKRIVTKVKILLFQKNFSNIFYELKFKYIFAENNNTDYGKGESI